ncbi:MAG: hypothetical protein HY748_03445 [Elusimicrobia bacterium]|nr:hypothetical protein [Elusimicrobiota bacterium]
MNRLLVFLVVALSAAAGAAADTSEPDAKFDKGEYQEALKGYESLLKDGSAEVRLKALYRSAESEALLFRYGEAAQRIFTAELPVDPLWKARFLILRAELGREFLKQYGHAAPEDSEEGTSDPAKRTPGEWHAMVAASYQALWEARASLARVPLAQEGYFVDLKDAGLDATPALWDFVVLRMSGYLLTEAPSNGIKPAARDFLMQDYKGTFSMKGAPAEAAGALLEDASRLQAPGRDAARGLWKIQRLMLPFQSSDRVSRSDDSKGELDSAIGLLLKWKETFPGLAAGQAALEAARLLNQRQKPDEAVAACRTIETRWPGVTARHASKLRAEIELPELSLSARFAPPPGRGSLRVLTKNLPAVHLRLYRTAPDALKDKQSQRWSPAWMSLRRPEEKLIEDYAARVPDHAWQVPVKSSSPYLPTWTPADPPALTPGLYLALAGSDADFKPGSSMVSAAIVNVTDLFLVATTGPKGPESDFIFDPASSPTRKTAGFHLYAMDAVSGRPRAAHVQAFMQDRWSEWKPGAIELDDAGKGGMAVDLKLSHEESNSISLDPLAISRESYAYLSYPASLHFSAPAPVQLQLETDRPIYRPGQEVAVKLTVLARIPRGYKALDDRPRVSLKSHDGNGQEFFEKTLQLNAMGSASVRFTIPAGRLLGRYGLTANVERYGRTHHGWAYYSVEEYKRPEFEVLVNESSGPWKYGEPAAVTGQAKYYFGGPVADAPVDFRVYREPFLPWWCWWWRSWGGSRGRVMVHSGRTTTGKDGEFSLRFTPLQPDDAGKDPWPSIFTVEAESRDPGGRTITAQRSFKAGAKAYLVSMTPSAGFFSAGRKGSVEVKLLNLDEAPVEGEVGFALNAVEGEPSFPESESPWAGHFQENVSLEEAFKDTPNGALVRSGNLTIKAGKPAKLELGGLDEGIYRLTTRAKDPWGGSVEQSIILVCAGKGERLPLNLPAVAIPEHASYLSGEKARVLVGSKQLKGAVHVEVWAGQFLLESRVLDNGGVRIVEVPVGFDHQGGFWARWFSAHDFRLESGQAAMEAPWKDKELSAVLDHDKVLKPGQRASWRLAVTDRAKKPVSGEATVRVFDRSLEYYMAADRPWVSGLYPGRNPPSGGQGSLFAPGVGGLAVTQGWVKNLLDLFRERIAEPTLPELRLNKSRVHSRRRFGRMKAKAGMHSAARMEAEASDKMAALDESAGGGGGHVLPGPPKPTAAGEPQTTAGPSGPAVKTRTDFSETALFEPHVKVTAGAGLISFKAPERLTSWKIQASVITRDVKRGSVQAETVTKKDLMVRVELPRFFREGDSGAIKALLHNETGDEISGDATLAIEEDGKASPEKLGLSADSLTKPVTIKPHAVQAVAWEVKAPRGATTFTVNAIGRFGVLADAEAKNLPILPSRQRLIGTAFLALDGDQKKEIKLAAFDEPDPTRINESMTLQIDPQLALSIINSLPFLVHYPFECVEQTLNRFVPLGIVNSFYKKHPGLADAVKKIPKRDTLTPAWDRSDPRRATDLMETPWVQISQGRKSPWPLIDLFDPATVKSQLQDSKDKLIQSQNADGSFPWFPGGRPDPYVTLLVLAGFAEAQRYGVDIPQEATAKALAYILSEIPRRLKPALKPEEDLVSMVLYAAYVVTSFDKGYGDLSRLRTQAFAWVDFADLHARAMTPMGKAYAAHVYWRLGDKAKGDQYLRRAMDGVREDSLSGVFWTPEKMSWLWYNDTVEKHAFLLRTLLLIRPKDPRIPGMVRWLMFNRKGNEWKSTKASAAAIYSLLDVLKTRGALDRGDYYAVKWGPDTHTASVAPMDWLAQPLRWIKTGMDIGPKHGTARLSKQGPGLGFASLTWIYTTDRPAKASGPGLLQLGRRFFLRVQEGQGFKLKPLKSGDTVKVGDQIEVKLTVATRSQFEYLHLKDPKLAGLEAEGLLSGWRWDKLSRYEEPRDSLTNFFLDWAPHGEYALGYRLRPTAAGSYRVGPAVLQSMYAPEMAAHSDGFELKVTE